MTSLPPRIKLLLILLPSLLALVGLLVHGPLPQPQAYHEFVDQRPWLGLPNAWNVLSNLGFFLVGALGVARLSRTAGTGQGVAERGYRLFFAGLLLTGVSSGFYHLEPQDTSLVLDRLTMVLAFAGILAALIEERLQAGWGLSLLPIFTGAGLVTLLYWTAGVAVGAGDVRWYLLYQILVMTALPLLLLLCPRPGAKSRALWGLVGAYVLAKVTEHFDVAIFALSGHFISGHSLKHLLAALGAYGLLRALSAADEDLSNREPHTSSFSP